MEVKINNQNKLESMLNREQELKHIGNIYGESNAADEFLDLTHSEKIVLLAWVTDKLQKQKSINYNESSYGLKHKFEKSPFGFYVSNGQFKGAMYLADFHVKNLYVLNWNFNISSSSCKQLDNYYD